MRGPESARQSESLSSSPERQRIRGSRSLSTSGFTAIQMSARTLEIDLSMAAHPPSPETKTTIVSDVPFFEGTSIKGSFIDVEAYAAVAKINEQKNIRGFMGRGGEQQVALS